MIERALVEPLHYTTVPSPVGRLFLVADDRALRILSFENERSLTQPEAGWQRGSPLLDEAARQLRQYFAGERTEFDVPLDPRGTPFQKACWQALREIPYGETRSYADQAESVGRPKAFRAVGGANHHNPIAIIIPCHRVIGKDGGLTGFGGGLGTKQRLLELETRVVAVSG